MDDGCDWLWGGRSRCEIPLLTVISGESKLPKRETEMKREKKRQREKTREQVVRGDDGGHA